MKVKKGQVILFAVCIVLGIVMSVLVSQGSGNINDSTSIEAVHRLLKRQEEEESLREEKRKKLTELEKKIDQFESNASQSNTYVKNIREELNKARVLAGLTDLEGPGVEVVLNDRKKETLPDMNGANDINLYLVHDEDVLRVINELSAAGAEAISINDTRIVSNTRIRCGGPTINVKNQPLAPPFVIRAIGDPDALMEFLVNPPDKGPYSISIYQELTDPQIGIEFTIKKMDHIIIPRYIDKLRFQHAKPYDEREGE